MFQIESKSEKAFWVMSQFDLIPREAPRAMNRSDSISRSSLQSWVDSGSIPWKAAWVMSWIDSIETKSLTEIQLEPWVDFNLFLGRNLIPKPEKWYTKGHFVSKAQKSHTKSNGMGIWVMDWFDSLLYFYPWDNFNQNSEIVFIR